MARINNIYKYKKKELNPESILLGSMSPNGETVNYNVVDVALFVAGYIGDVEAGIQSIQEGDNISIDNTDPKNPIVSSIASGGDTNIIESISRNGTPITPDGSKNVDIPIFSTSGAGLVPARVGAVATKYLREDGNWVTPTNTTYTAMTLPVLNTGIATTANTISAQVLTNWLNGKISTVGFSGSYDDLTDKPTIPTQINLIEGTNIEITGTYPNITISATVEPTEWSQTDW